MSGSPSTPSVLIVEDEPRYRDFLAEVLRGMDLSPIVAPTAHDALRLVQSSPPDLLFLDLNLPVMDGMAFLEQFRRTCPDAPVVIITGFGDLNSARRAIRLGVTDFLTKPCDLGQLELAIDRARRQLPQPAPPAAAPPPIPTTHEDSTRTLATLEREAIVQVLHQSRGNRTAAVRTLGISRRALYNKLAEYQRQGHQIG